MIDKIKKLLQGLANDGIPSYVLIDPTTDQPSLTYSLFYLNGLLAILGLVGRFANLVAGVDADAAKELLIVTGGLYLGRTLTRAISKKEDKSE